MKSKLLSYMFIFLAVCGVVVAHDTIEEKIASLETTADESSCQKSGLTSQQILMRLKKLRRDLKERYNEAQEMVDQELREEACMELLGEISDLKKEIAFLEEEWRTLQSEEVFNESDGYGIWEHEETTVSELVMEYGSTEYLYIIPPEIATQKLHVHSALLIPRESWSALLETIFKHNGIGVREINPYARQLFLLKQDYISFSTIFTKHEQLNLVDRRERVAFVLSPPVAHLKQAFYFIERFRDPKTTFVYQVGAKIAIVGFQEDVKRLVTLCDNVWEKGEEKSVRVVSSPKLQSEEVIKLLKSYFGTLSDPSRTIITLKGGHDLSATPLTNEAGVILVGARPLVEQAERIIRETEQQVSDPSELTVFWHTCSHSDPKELAEVLEQVYASLIHSSVEGQPEAESNDPFAANPFDDFDDDDDDDDEFGVPYEQVKPWSTRLRQNRNKEKQGSASEEKNKPGNFIPYPSTGSILMVVRRDMMNKIKEVIRRLDIPKRMVEIEVLLVERRLKNSSRSGINILKLGSTASNTNQLGVEYNGEKTKTKSQGLFEFIYSGVKNSHFPAIDLSYNFLLSQEDIRVTAAPSVITVNQSPATIAVTDQISINNGASPVETNKGFVFKDSFERADFGITIKLVPTIHEPEIGDEEKQIFVTLDNEISFETIRNADRASDFKPDVHKRQVKNQVRVADGQTVILGGLKNKTQEDKSDKIPFLGEIPGFGKLFGTNVLSDSSGEMFIFIKPSVVNDPIRDLERMREEKLRTRPGDSQIFLNKIAESRKKTSERAFQRSFELFFGMREDATVNL